MTSKYNTEKRKEIGMLKSNDMILSALKKAEANEARSIMSEYS